MIHYHGTPISPRAVLNTLRGRHFCVSYYAGGDVKVCHEIGQSVMLDNGAYSYWTRRETPQWWGYYAWCDTWLACPTTWAVIPDIIDGSESANDRLLHEWPHGQRQAAPVWHLHESLQRLSYLAGNWWRICFGSSGEYARVGSAKWRERVADAFDKITVNGRLTNWVHMLRGMALSGECYPFASVDSTDVARNHHRAGNVAVDMASRWDGLQSPYIWCGVPRTAKLAFQNEGAKQ